MVKLYRWIMIRSCHKMQDRTEREICQLEAKMLKLECIERKYLRKWGMI